MPWICNYCGGEMVAADEVYVSPKGQRRTFKHKPFSLAPVGFVSKEQRYSLAKPRYGDVFEAVKDEDGLYVKHSPVCAMRQAAVSKAKWEARNARVD